MLVQKFSKTLSFALCISVSSVLTNANEQNNPTKALWGGGQ